MRNNKWNVYLTGILFLVFGMSIHAQNSSTFGNIFIHSEGNMTEFSINNYDTQNQNSQPGIVGGERVPTKGYFNYAPGAGWTNADDLKFIDGYVRFFGNAPFVFPVGDNNKFRPAAISGGSYVEAAYYGIDPTSAITSDIRGGNFPVLPGTGPFNSSAYEDIVTKVSEWEYWDINGTDPTIITLTWDTESYADLITNNDLERLTIVGWNGTEWEAIPSELDFRMLDLTDYAANFNGSTPSLPQGSISTKSSVIPSSYEVYTLGSSCINIDLETERSHTICKGDPLQLTATSYDDATITWSTSQTGENITVNPDASTVYSVTAKVGGCEISKDVNVEVRDIFVELGQDTFVCRGQDLTLIPDGTQDGFYQWDDGNTVRFADQITINLNSPDDIFVTITDNFGCTDEDQIYVDVREAPDVDTGRDRKACLGDTVFLQARGLTNEMAGGYEWSTGDTEDFIWVSPLETTTYQVSLTENGCTDISFATVTIFPEAYVEIMTDPIICGTEEMTIETQGSDGRFSWSNGSTDETITVNPQDGDSYSVTVTSNGNCFYTDEITFSVYSGADLGNDINICTGQELNIDVSGDFDSVQWDNGSSDTSRNIQPLATTTYSVTTTYNGCEGTDEVTVTVGGDLDVDLGEDITVCKGELVTLTTDAAGQYYWSNGMNTPSINVVPFITTTYSVTVYSGDCEATDEITVTVDEDAAYVNILNDEIVCPGGVVIMETEGSDGFYEWSNGNFGESITVSSNPGDTYSVTVTAPNGCTAVDEITFMSFEETAANLGEDIDMCIGESLTLEIPGDWDDIMWSNGATNNFITLAPLSTETYSVTVTKDNCESTDDIVVNVVSNLQLDLGNDISICAGESVDLSDPSVSGDFEWNTGQTSSVISVSPLATATYTATISSGNCEATDEITVHVEELEVIIEANDIFCEGEEVTLKATGSQGSYEWSTGVTNDEITISPNPDIVYSVTLTSASGCTAVDEITFSAFDNNNIDLGEDIEICVGEDVSLELEGLYDSAVWNDGVTGGVNTVSPISTQTYSVTATLGNCQVIDEITVNVVSQLNLDLGNDIVICSGQQVELGGNVGGQYTWSTGQSTSTIMVSPTETTTYTANVTSGSCEATDQIKVVVEELAFVQIQGSNVICNGDEVTLQASGSQGTYEWNTGETNPSITFRPNPGETYSVTVTTSTGCTGSAEIKFEAFEDQSIDLGQDLQICQGATVVLDINGVFDNVVWSDGSTASTLTVRPTETTTYSVTADYGNCQTSDFVTVEVVQSLDLDLGNDITICNGQEIEITSNVGGLHQWSTGETTSSIFVSPTETTTYTATAFSSNCDATDEITIIVENMAFVEIVSDTIYCPGDQITLEANGSPGSYEWNTGATGQSVTLTPSDNTAYSVTVTSSNGCQFSDEVIVQSFESNYIDLGNDLTVCTGQTVSLDIEGTYDSVIWDNGQATPSIDITPVSTTSYSVTATYNGCTAMDEITVNVASSIDLDLGDDMTICNGGVIELSNSIAGDYMWSTGETTSSIFVEPYEETTYSVSVTSGTCEAQDEITIFVDNVMVEIDGVDILCESGDVSLTAIGPADATYNWSTGDTGQNISFVGIPNVSYRVTMTTPGGCTATDETSFSQYDAASVDIGPDLFVCAGSDVHLEATGLYDNIEWSTGEMGTSISVSPAQTTTYTMTAIYGNCSTQEEITVNVANDIDVDLGSDIVICPGQTVELKDISVYGTFEWSTGETRSIISVSPTTTQTYSLTVNSGNCSDTDEVQVIVQNDCTADLYLLKSVNNFSPKVGDIITFEVLAGNSSSTVTATNVVVDEDIRSGFRYISSTASNGVYDVNTSSWYIDEIAPDGTETLEIQVEVLISGDYKNIAEIMASDQDDNDSQPGNGNDNEDDYERLELDVVNNQIVDNTSEIGDRIWYDTNGDGVQQDGELGIPNIEINLYTATNINNTLRSTTSDSQGKYIFRDLSSGDYFVEFVIPAGMVETVPNVNGSGGGNTEAIDSDIENTFGFGTTKIINLGIDESYILADGGIYDGGSIGDLVWFDSFGGIENRYDDMIDSGVEDVVLHLINLEGDTIDTQITDASGFYSFDNLKADSYFVSIEIPENRGLLLPKQAAEDVDNDFREIGGMLDVGESVVINLGPSEVREDIDAGLTFTLPLYMNDFWGERIYEEQFNRLFWTTLSESNTSHFTVQRSLESTDNFKDIGRIEAAGNSSDKMYYSFDDLDSRQSGLYYYRLLMVDLNGVFTYSKIISINVEGEDGDEETQIPFKVYPIPTSDFVTLEVTTPSEMQFYGFLVNNLGQNVRKIEKSNIPGGVNRVQLNVTDLPQGEYYLNFYVGEKQFIARILKMD